MRRTKKTRHNKRKHILRKNTRKKSNNTRKKSNNTKRKRSRKLRTNMRGGIAAFLNTSDSSRANTYSKSDTPTMPPNAGAYVPSPIKDLKWSLDSEIKNFFNKLVGQPRQYTSSPTDQPIGKTKMPITPTPLTSKDLNNFKTQILNTYSANANTPA